MIAPPAAETPYRVDAETLRRDAATLVLLVLDVLFGAFAWGFLPARVPIHWNATGRIDGWGPSWVNAFVLPAIAIATYLLFLFIPFLDPMRRNYARFADSLRVFRLLLAAFLVFVHVLVVVASMGVDVRVDVAIRAALPLLFVGLGTRLPRLEPNWFFGIRTPWTLANAEVWTRTHRLAGTLWTFGGLLLVPLAFLPPRTGLAGFVAGILVLVLVPTAYSAILYRRIAD
jgi:uncharacterized membrane protein